jgi:hypothetical protein
VCAGELELSLYPPMLLRESLCDGEPSLKPAMPLLRASMWVDKLSLEPRMPLRDGELSLKPAMPLLRASMCIDKLSLEPKMPLRDGEPS